MAVPELYTPADAPEVAALISRLYPDWALSADEVRRGDRDQQDAGHRHARAVIRATGILSTGRLSTGGALVGLAGYTQPLGQSHPRTFSAELIVAPAHRGYGFGTALFGWLAQQIQALGALSLRVTVREAEAGARRFASQRGFLEDGRSWVSSVAPCAVDLTPLPALEARLMAQGVHLLTASELALRDPDNWRAQLHALFSEVRLDVPRSEPPTPVSLSQFLAQVLDDEDFTPDAYFLAETAQDGLVGLSDLYRTPASPDLFVGLSGVRRSWRRRGVATALKLRGLEYARRQGVARVWTDNESGNTAILSINDRLGFVRESALLSLVLRWGEWTDSAGG